MSVTANQGVESAALENKMRIEATQAERNDIAASEQMNAEPIEGAETQERELKEGEVDITDHKPTLDPRTECANALVQQARERRDQEIKDAEDNNGYRPESEHQPEELEGDFEEEPPELDQQFDNNASDDVNLNQPGFYGDTVVLKINGQNVRMDADKALSILQKDQSADQKLEQASLKEQELRQREFAIQQKEQYQPPVQGVEKANSAEVQEEIRKSFELFEEGETEQAVEHMTKVLSRQQPTLNPEQIARRVRSELKVEEARSVESRLKGSGKYDDVFNNPTAFELAVKNVRHLNSQGFSASTEETMIEAIEMVRDFRSGQSRQERQARSQDDKPNNRRQQKRKVQRPIASGANVQRKAVVKQNQPTEADRRKDLFNKAKAARNQ